MFGMDFAGLACLKRTLVNVFEQYCSVKEWRVCVSYSVILLTSSDSETHRYKTFSFSVIL